MIYNFLSLCLAYVGGPGSVEVMHWHLHQGHLPQGCTYVTCLSHARRLLTHGYSDVLDVHAQ